MRAINLTDKNRTDSPVAFEPVTPLQETSYGLEEGGSVRPVKLIKSVQHTRYAALQELATERSCEIETLLIEDDPDIDFDYCGKISTKTKTIYLSDSGAIAYQVRMMECQYDRGGTPGETRDHIRQPANVNPDQPLKWTGRYFPIGEVIRRFAFGKIYQLRHVNGLTYDFLHGMAALLEKKRAFVLMGAGEDGKEPLRLTRGSLPYRAFLHGRTQGDAYRLTLHLTNLELKDIS